MLPTVLLPTVWFVLIAILWIGYLFLEGFDLGVGIHMTLSARSESERRVMLNAIGPVWDGNEVWLVTAVGATFAAFPLWYASLLSALYLPLVFVLLGLIFRAVAIEYRGKGNSARWIRGWNLALGVGSLVSAFGIGVLLAATTTGLPLNANGDRVGGAFAWMTGSAILGGVAAVGFCLVHAAAFLALKTSGTVRVNAHRFVGRWAPVALLPFVGWILVLQFRSATLGSAALSVLAILAVLGAVFANRAGREGWSFVGFGVFVVAAMGAIFSAAYPVVLPSTISSAFDLTAAHAASSPYTLGVMTVVAACGLPLVLGYQGWTYWVFRRRVSAEQIPAAHAITPAVRS